MLLHVALKIKPSVHSLGEHYISSKSDDAFKHHLVEQQALLQGQLRHRPKQCETIVTKVCKFLRLVPLMGS
jgi:hypothetical protein